MPGAKTHQIFYKQLKEYIGEDAVKSLPGYDIYSIFAQGHDLLIYHDFYKIYNQSQLRKNVNASKQLQEYLFSEFIYCYLKCAEQIGVLNNEQVRLFIGPGYVGHHLLDAYTHPLIIYFAGDHVRDAKNKTWNHGIAENLIDIYVMNHVEKKDAQTYPVHRDFRVPFRRMSEELKTVLNDSLKWVYGITNGGEIFEEACLQVSQFIHLFKHDPKGIKRKVFDGLDPILKGTASFSYCRSEDNVEHFLNNSHEKWVNPMDANIQSQASFMDLYQKALKDCSEIIKRLEKVCLQGHIQRDEIYDIVPNFASTHGLPCGKTIEIKYTKEIYEHE